MKRAADIMTSPVTTVGPATPLTQVAKILLENGISGCPVMDTSGALRGIVSRANVLDFALSVEGGALTPIVKYLVPGVDEMVEEEAWAPLEEDGYHVPEAQEIMTTDVVAVSPDATLGEVAAILHQERIHRVPVMDDKRLVGIITSLDLLGSWPG